MDLIRNVAVVNLYNTRQVRIQWENSARVSHYKVYRSATPYGPFEEIASVDRPVNYYVDSPTIIPINEWYYKVAEFDGTTVGPVPKYGITHVNYDAFTNSPFSDQAPDFYPTNDDMKFYFEEIRRRHLWMLENGGESMKLLKRRWEGTRCPHASGAAGQCPFPLKDPACYGTNFVGGYYSAYSIIVRRQDADQLIQLQGMSLRVEQKPRMRTIWTPRLSSGDLLVDSSNQRWEITNLHPQPWRGLITHQVFDVELKNPRDLVYQVPV